MQFVSYWNNSQSNKIDEMKWMRFIKSLASALDRTMTMEKHGDMRMHSAFSWAWSAWFLIFKKKQQKENKKRENPMDGSKSRNT